MGNNWMGENILIYVLWNNFSNILNLLQKFICYLYVSIYTDQKNMEDLLIC